MLSRSSGYHGYQIQFVLNQKTAKAIGFTISPLVFTRADEVIE